MGSKQKRDGRWFIKTKLNLKPRGNAGNFLESLLSYPWSRHFTGKARRGINVYCVPERQCQPEAMSCDDLIIRSSSSFLPFAGKWKSIPQQTSFEEEIPTRKKKTFIRTLNCKCQFCLFPHWIRFVKLMLADLRATHFNTEPNSMRGTNTYYVRWEGGQYLTIFERKFVCQRRGLWPRFGGRTVESWGWISLKSQQRNMPAVPKIWLRKF